MFRSLTDAEQEKYAAAAQGANFARQLGFPAFATAKDNRANKKKAPWNRGLLAGPSLAAPMLLAGEQTAAGAIAAQDAQPVHDVDGIGGQVTQRLQTSFPDIYAQFVKGLLPWTDPLQLSETEEQLGDFCIKT